MNRIILCLLVAAGSMCAQVPRTITFTGVLTDSNGVVRPNGSQLVTFALFDQDNGGTPLWSETSTVTSVRGLFEHALGSVTPFPASLDFDRAYWLQITESGQPLLPRTALRMQPYAFRAVVADSATRVPQTPFTGVSGITDGSTTLRDLVRIVEGSNIRITVDPSGITIAARDTVTHALTADTAAFAHRAPSVPVGTIMAFAGTWSGATKTQLEAEGWMLCDGAGIERSTYSQLLSVIGITYGPGDGITTFNLPDLRGYFLRGASPAGLDDGQGLARDPGAPRAVGSYQQDAFQGHIHNLTKIITGGNGNGIWTAPTAGPGSVDVANAVISSPVSDGVSGTPRSAPESRPKNIAVNYIIKVR